MTVKKETKAEREKRHAEWRRKHGERQHDAAEALADFWLEFTRDCESNINFVRLGQWMALMNAASDYFWSRDHVTRNGEES